MLYPAANNPLIGEIKNLLPVPANPDPDCDKIVLLMHMDGDIVPSGAFVSSRFEGSNLSTTIVNDVGTHPTVLASTGISTARSKFGSSSLRVAPTGGSTAGLYQAAGTVNLGSNPWTLSCWIFVENPVPYATIIVANNSYTGFPVLARLDADSSGALQLGSENGSGGPTMPVGVWTHIAFVRSGNTFKAFINGTQVYTVSFSYSATANAYKLFSSSDSGLVFYVDDFQFIAGTALYTDNFSVPGALPSYAVIDECFNTTVKYGDVKLSAAERVFGATSAYFDGVGDYLTVSHAADLQFPADFTISFFVRVTAAPTSSAGAGLVGKRDTTSAAGNWIILLNSPGSLAIKFQLHNGTGWINYDIGTAVLNTWHHIAVTRSAGILRTFFGGVKGSEVSVADNVSGGTNPITLGLNSTTGFLTGYIDELCIWKGAAKWTANFTPPTAPGQICGEPGVLLQEANLGLEWQVFGSISGLQQISWELLQPVSADVQLSWEILTWGTSSDLSLAWRLGVETAGNLAIQWPLAVKTGSDLLLSWAVATVTTLDLTTSWTAAPITAADLVISWSSAVAVSSDLVLSYNIALSAGASESLSWALGVPTISDFSIFWTSAAATSISETLAWSIGQIASVDLSLSNSLGYVTASDLLVPWQFTQVQDNLHLSWKISIP